MANKFINNNVKRACGIKTCGVLPAFAPKQLVNEIDAIEAELVRIETEKLKWTSDQADATLRKRLEDAQSDPSSANLAKFSEESPEELKKRFAATNEALTGIYYTRRAAASSAMVRLLEAFKPALEREMKNMESAHRARFEQFGAVYNPDEDVLLKSLAKLLENAESMLSSKHGIDPRDLKTFLGPLRIAPGGLLAGVASLF